jgi:hypothetical protein
LICDELGSLSRARPCWLVVEVSARGTALGYKIIYPLRDTTLDS